MWRVGDPPFNEQILTAEGGKIGFQWQEWFRKITRAADDIARELQERNNVKFGVSLTNAAGQMIPDGVATALTFDTVIFDDSLMFNAPDTVKVNRNAQWLVMGRVKFCGPTDTVVARHINVKLNDVTQFETAVVTEASGIYPFIGLIEAFQDDLITVEVIQMSEEDMEVLPSLQVIRASYIHEMVGRNLESPDEEICPIDTGGGGGGGGGSSGSCDGTCSASTPPPGGEVPGWFLGLINGAGAGNCYDPAILAAIEGSLNSMNYFLQRSSPAACNIRGRLYFSATSTPDACSGFLQATDFSSPHDVVRPDCGWTWT